MATNARENRFAQIGYELSKSDPLVGVVRALVPTKERRIFDCAVGILDAGLAEGDMPSHGWILGERMAIAFHKGRKLPAPPDLVSTKVLAGYFTAVGSQWNAAVIARLKRDGAVWVGAKTAVDLHTNIDVDAYRIPPRTTDCGTATDAHSASFGGEGPFDQVFGSELGYGGFASFGASAGLDVSAFTDPNVLNTFQSTLGAVGVPSDSISAAQTAYANLPGSVQDAVGDVIGTFNSIPPSIRSAGGDIISGALHGNISPESMMPLVSMGLAATGVGAPVAGLVAAAVPIAESVGQALGLMGRPDQSAQCAWIVSDGAIAPSPSALSGGSMSKSDSELKHHSWEGYGCFRKKRPYGPKDPVWVKWGDYVKKNSTKMANGMTVAIPAFPEWSAIAQGLEDLANAGNKKYTKKLDDGRVLKVGGGNPFFPGYLWGAPQVEREFAALYFAMWQANAELAINGHKYASDADVLTAAVKAWNTHHTGGAPFTLKPVSGAAPQVPNYSKQWFVTALLNGDIDGNDRPPVTLNTQAAPKTVAKKVIPLHLGPTATHPSAPKKVIPLKLGNTSTKAAKPAVAAKLVAKSWWPTALGTVLGGAVGGIPGAIGGGFGAHWLDKKLRGQK